MEWAVSNTARVDGSSRLCVWLTHDTEFKLLGLWFVGHLG
jgi:hypothetical protein